MGTQAPIVFNAGAISKWLVRIEKTETDIIKSLTSMNDHEISQLIYTGMEYGYGIQGVGKCPYSFYEVEEYILEKMGHENAREFEDLLIFAMECVIGRVERIAKKNGIDLNMSTFIQEMRTNWENNDPAKTENKETVT